MHAQELIKPGSSATELISFTDTLRNLSWPLTKELQFNDWFFQSIKSILEPFGFIVDTGDTNSILQEDLNEYWYTSPDGMINKADSFSRKYMSSVTIKIDDNSSEEMNVEDFLLVEGVHGQVIEVKQPYYTVSV